MFLPVFKNYILYLGFFGKVFGIRLDLLKSVSVTNPYAEKGSDMINVDK